MRRVLFGLLAMVITPLCSPLWAQNYPDYDEIYVNDFANLLSVETKNDIRSRLKDLREETGIEFTIVTIQQMSDYGDLTVLEPFATGLFNFWGVGDAERNDGVMMLVSLWDREIRLEVGSGYGSSMDGEMKKVIDYHILPHFREDRYEEGISKGVDHTILAITGTWPGEYNASLPQKLYNAASRSIQGLIQLLGGWIYAILAVVLPFPIHLYRRWKRNQPRICPNDGQRMVRLDEEWDDNHLQKGQITEEQLKSVDYDVWECRSCHHIKVEGYRSWFTSYAICRNCGYRTVEGETTVLEDATTSSTGLKRIDYHCHNCGDAYSVERVIPRESKSSSSSGGSFGGGSSSGGGASGRW